MAPRRPGPRRISLDDDTLRRLLPEGTQPPADLPPRVFAAALATFVAERRLDMSLLATELSLGRATLYRQAGPRDRLLGEVIWYLARRAIDRALRGAGDRSGADRVLFVAERFMRYLERQRPLRRFLEEEPEAALRVLTSKQGVVQGRLVQTLARLLEEETAEGNLHPTMDPQTLAFLIVRVGETFLYADVIADNPPDIDQAIEIIGLLLRSA